MGEPDVVTVTWGKGLLQGYSLEEARDGKFVVLPREESERRAGAAQAEGSVSGGSLVGREAKAKGGQGE